MRYLAAGLILFVAASSGTAGAAQKVYEGSEAAALRCANIVALTAVALNDAGGIGDLEKDVMLGISFMMLGIAAVTFLRRRN